MKNLVITLAAGVLFGSLLAGCAPSGETKTEGEKPVASEKLTGSIAIDGSSTVGPISEALAEEFKKEQPDVNVTVAQSGTGGGFKKFAAGEIDISGASRPIEEKEIEAAAKNGIEFIELPIAFDGLSIVVNPGNDYVSTITVADLKKLWEPKSVVQMWSDLNPAWPKERIKLYGPGTDSGTFDYFTKAIVGEEKASRSDYQASEDDNTLVQGVAGDKFALGYFGYAYVEQNKDKLKLLKVDDSNGGIEPTPETIADGTYKPLSRPLFWYVNKKSLEDKPAIAALVKFLVANSEVIKSTGYVPLPAEAYTLVAKRTESKTTGTLFKGVTPGMKISDILAKESGK
jgi:phosphate transport system substrate-binding protein